MRSYGHLFEQFLSDENYYLAVRNATKRKGGKRRKCRISMRYRENADIYKDRLLRYAENFKGKTHHAIEIYDGIRRKRRSIVVPSMDEQIVHHMLINVMKPTMMHGMYEHSYGSIPERGPHLAKRRIERWIRHGGRSCKYVLKMDIRKFFDSVPHDRMKESLGRVVRDRRLMRVIEEVIDSAPSDRGLPIGFYTSQWFANFYLTGLDHFIKESLGAKYYVRYMDDMVIFGPNKRRLHAVRREVGLYLNEVLGLEMKHDWQVFLFDYPTDGGRKGRSLDFMGFRFWRDHVTLRRSLMLRMTRKAKRLAKKVRDGGRKTVHDARQMLSYLGWIDATDTYEMFRRRVKPYANFRCMRRQVGRYQRRLNLQAALG